MTTTEQFIQERKYARSVSPRTVEWYKHAFKVFAGCGLEAPADCTPSALAGKVKQRIIELRQSGKCKPISINSWLRVINAYLKWLSDEEHVSKRVKIPRLKEPETVIEPWTVEQVQQLVHYKPTRMAKKRVQTLALLIADTGLRISEALALRREDIDLDSLSLTVRRGKGGKTRVVPFSVIGRKFLVRWLAVHERELVFCNREGLPLTIRNISHSLELLCNELDINGVRSWHSLRHSFAAAYIRDGGDPFSLQRILGHASIAMTMRYVRLNSTDLVNKHSQHARLLSGK